MANMQDADRFAVWKDWMIQNLAPIGVAKADVRAAINAADAWADSNASSYNTALPVPFRTTATAAQKALVLVLVIARRHLLGL